MVSSYAGCAPLRAPCPYIRYIWIWARRGINGPPGVSVSLSAVLGGLINATPLGRGIQSGTGVVGVLSGMGIRVGVDWRGTCLYLVSANRHAFLSHGPNVVMGMCGSGSVVSVFSSRGLG